MKYLIMGGGIIGAAIVFTLWLITTGAGYLRDSLPLWLGGGEKILAVAIQEAEKVFPGVRENVESVVPGITGKVTEVDPRYQLNCKRRCRRGHTTNPPTGQYGSSILHGQQSEKDSCLQGKDRPRCSNRLL